mmetsp:Transcript_16721/g.26880  ORF Transcript_16721/g.26880 Transcript_16721/m.26880 type:complete len:209 (-) Transcript_16721:101-727(-)
MFTPVIFEDSLLGPCVVLLANRANFSPSDAASNTAAPRTGVGMEAARDLGGVGAGAAATATAVEVCAIAPSARAAAAAASPCDARTGADSSLMESAAGAAATSTSVAVVDVGVTSVATERCDSPSPAPPLASADAAADVGYATPAARRGRAADARRPPRLCPDRRAALPSSAGCARNANALMGWRCAGDWGRDGEGALKCALRILFCG